MIATKNRVLCGARSANVEADATVGELRTALNSDLQIPSGAKARVSNESGQSRLVTDEYRLGTGEQLEFDREAGVGG